MQKVNHPAVFVTAGFFLIVLLQTVALVALPWMVAVVVVLSLVGARFDWLRIMRRLRYIFLALFILFSWQTPGTLVLPFLGVFSPTWDGMRAVIEPCLRLLGVVSVIALMLHRLKTEEWVSSLYAVAAPLRVFGFSPERFAVRLRLVLDYMEERDLNWRHCLDSASQPQSEEFEGKWLIHALRWSDKLMITVVLAMLFGWLVW